MQSLSLREIELTPLRANTGIIVSAQNWGFAAIVTAIMLRFLRKMSDNLRR
jgi:hypothetical protein